MLKLFGDYLVEKKIISTDQLLDCLFEQVRTTPPVAETCHNQKLLTAEQILSVLRLQTQKGGDFKSVAQHLGLWQSAFDDIITKAVGAHRTPIGQLIIKKGYSNVQQLTAALDDYLASQKDAQREENSQASSANSAYSVNATSQDQAPSAEIQNPTPYQFNKIEPALLPDCLSAYTDQIDSLEALLNLDVTDSNTINLLSQVLHTLKGSARFFRLPLTGELCSILEDYIKQIPLPDSARDISLESTSIFRSLKSSISENGSEEAFWQNRELQGRYKSLCTTLRPKE